MRPRLRQTALAAIAIVVALWTPAAAVAAPAAPTPQLALDIRSRGMPAGAVGGKIVEARYGVQFGPPPSEVTFVLDATAAAEALRITVAEPTPGCAQSGAVLTCTLPVVNADRRRNVLRLRYTPTADARPGMEVTFDESLTAPDAVPVLLRQGFSLTGPLPDLASATAHVDNVVPGSKVPVYPSFRNWGDAAASGVLLTMSLPAAQSVRDRYRNCYYHEADVLCPFPDFAVAPGERVAVSPQTPIRAPVAASSAGRDTLSVRYSVDPTAAGELFDPGDAVRGTGPLLRLERSAAEHPASAELSRPGGSTGSDAVQTDVPDADFLDNEGNFYLHTTSNPADLAAGARVVRGRPGETVPMALLLTNHGPARLIGTGDTDARWNLPTWASLTVDVPSSVEVVSSACYQFTGDVVGEPGPGANRYRCFFADNVEPGTTVTTTMRVKVRSTAPSTGTVTAAGGTDDPMARNNTATIQVNPRAAAPAGGGGGGLPITGSDPARYAWAGGALILTGALLVLSARRPGGRSLGA